MKEELKEALYRGSRPYALEILNTQGLALLLMTCASSVLFQSPNHLFIHSVIHSKIPYLPKNIGMSVPSDMASDYRIPQTFLYSHFPGSPQQVPIASILEWLSLWYL